MGLTGVGGVGLSASSGTKRTVDIYHSISVRHNVDSFTGFQAIWNDGWCARSGSYLTGFFPTGANPVSGIAPNAAIGMPHIFASAGVTLRDMMCVITPRVRLVRPLVQLPDPFAVWEVEAWMILNAPGAALVNDAGLILHGMTSFTGVALGNDFTSGAGLGQPGHLGVACQFTGANGQLQYQSRAAFNGGLQETVNVGVGPFVSPRVVRAKFRLESATPATDAKCSLFIDDALAVSRDMVPGALLPNVNCQNTVQNNLWLGAFRPFFRQGGNNVAGAAVSFAYWRVSAAASVADMIGA